MALNATKGIQNSNHHPTVAKLSTSSNASTVSLLWKNHQLSLFYPIMKAVHDSMVGEAVIHVIEQ